MFVCLDLGRNFRVEFVEESGNWKAVLYNGNNQMGTRSGFFNFCGMPSLVLEKKIKDMARKIVQDLELNIIELKKIL